MPVITVCLLSLTLFKTSMKVVEIFGKQHKNVLQAMDRLLEDQDVSNRLNFQQCFKINELANGKSERYFEMDRDGFTLLSMGFTGKQALQFKLSYIDAFNKAESLLKNISYSTARPEIEAADIFKSFNEIGKLIGFDVNMAAFSANTATRKITSVNMPSLPKDIFDTRLV